MHRETILRVVINNKSHPGADWIYNQVRKEIPNISMGTVYHNLKLLAEAGHIREIEIPGSFSRFDGNKDNHYHFRCDGCGRLFDLDQPIDHTIEATIAKQTGFKVKRHNLEFIGLCLDC